MLLAILALAMSQSPCPIHIGVNNEGYIAPPHSPQPACHTRSMLKKIAVLLVCAFCCLTLAASAQTRTHKVIFVITSPDQNDWSTATTLADHFLAGIKPEPADVEVLSYGPAIPILAKNSPIAKEIADLEKLGVHFVACRNAMRAFKIAETDLLPGVTSVPSGVVELVRRQEAGYSYVKVGR
jgi:intracellular sulfur oxidation DsrE/DsrF family protein